MRTPHAMCPASCGSFSSSSPTTDEPSPPHFHPAVGVVSDGVDARRHRSSANRLRGERKEHETSRGRVDSLVWVPLSPELGKQFRFNSVTRHGRSSLSLEKHFAVVPRVGTSAGVPLGSSGEAYKKALVRMVCRCRLVTSRRLGKPTKFLGEGAVLWAVFPLLGSRNPLLGPA
ncbi:hypothetical protein BHM03_00034040 [Ensete ventricosum]|nr:hypothetical protein BHM03_00034040 [Ensete ventricosum]